MKHLRFLLDTNICIYIQRRRSPKVLSRFSKLAPGEAAISVVTWGELAYGACKSSQRAAVMQILREFVALIPVLPMSAQAGMAYGEIRAALESDGTPIGNNDLWIAAQARAAGLTLVTNNQRGFTRVPGLEVHNWA